MANITLPAVLLLTFLRVDLESRHLVIVALMFSAWVLALLLARVANPPLG